MTRKTLMIKIPSGTHTNIKATAALKGQSINKIVGDFLNRQFAQPKLMQLLRA